MKKKETHNSNLWVVECKTGTRYIRYKLTKLKCPPPPIITEANWLYLEPKPLLLWSRLVYILPVHLVIKWQWLRPWKLDEKISNAKGGGEWLVTDERKVKWIRSIIEMWRKGGGGGEGSVMNPFLNPGQTRVITAPHQASSKATHSSWRLPCLQTRNWKEGDRRDLTKPDPIPTSIEMSSLASRKKYSFSDDIWILCPSKTKNHDKSGKKESYMSCRWPVVNV
jgi:hypothetical protein